MSQSVNKVEQNLAGNESEAEACDACLHVAEQLLQVLHEEAQALKEFKTQALLSVLPRKEFLIGELERKSRFLKPKSNAVGTGASRSALKEVMEEIEKQNSVNRIFIEGSLAHWKDFLDTITAAGYCPPFDAPSRWKPLPVKGIELSREV